jgi:hypothetical protein
MNVYTATGKRRAPTEGWSLPELRSLRAGEPEHALNRAMAAFAPHAAHALNDLVPAYVNHPGCGVSVAKPGLT